MTAKDESVKKSILTCAFFGILLLVRIENKNTVAPVYKKIAKENHWIVTLNSVQNQRT